MTNSQSTTYCSDSQGHVMGATTYVDSWAYHDGWGVVHPFSGTIIQNSCPGLPSNVSSFTSVATDGSGYTRQCWDDGRKLAGIR
jgi:hypothetical protein